LHTVFIVIVHRRHRTAATSATAAATCVVDRFTLVH
jgi:hypothetical protein